MAFATFAAPLTRNEHPKDEFIIMRYGPVAAAALANASFAIGVVDRACDIMSITIRQEGTAASAGTIQFKVAASATAIGSGTAISAADAASGLTAATPFNVTMAQSNSPHLDLAAGTVIGFTTASSIDNVSNLVITVRLRTRKYRTTDAGNKEWFDAA